MVAISSKENRALVGDFDRPFLEATALVKAPLT